MNWMLNLAWTERYCVINASPLILLGKLGHLRMLEQMTAAVQVPDAVIAEVSVGKGEANLGETLHWAAQRRLADQPIPTEVAAWDLGLGETHVLNHCLLQNRFAILDDAEARAAAKVFGIPVFGTLGVVLQARLQGLIPAARPVVAQLVASGSYLAPELVERALAKVGE